MLSEWPALSSLLTKLTKGCNCVTKDVMYLMFFVWTDSLKKKVNALPSPEREITTVNLKKDVKYGLGKSE